MENNKIKEKLEKASLLADTRRKEIQEDLYSKRLTALHIQNTNTQVETGKGHLLKALGQYRLSSENRKAVRQEKHFLKMSEKVSSLTSDLNNLEEKYIEKNQLFEIKQRKIIEMKDEVKNLSSRLQITKENIKNKDIALVENESFAEDLRSELNELRGQLSKCEQEHGNKKKGTEWQEALLVELEAEKKSVEIELSHKEEEYNNFKTSHEKSLNEIDSIKVSMQNLKKSSTLMTDRIFDSKTRIKECELRKHELNKDASELKRDLNAQTELFKKNQGKLNRLDEYNDDLESRVLKYESAKKHLDQVVFEKKNVLGNLEAEILKNKNKLVKLVENNNREKVLLAEKDSHLSNLREEISLLREKNNEQERSLQVVREEFFEVKREFDRKDKNYQDLKEQKEVGQKELMRLDKEILSKKNEISKMNVEMESGDSKLKELNININSFGKELDHISMIHTDLKNKRDVLFREKNTATERSKILSQKITTLEASIQKINSDISSSQETVHLKEEEELFFSKKIEALESLIVEKRKREEYVNQKKASQEKIASDIRRKLEDVNQKYEMAKSREENEKRSLRVENLELDKVKVEITKIESEMRNTLKTISDLKEKRKTLAEETQKAIKEKEFRNKKFHQILSEGIDTGDDGTCFVRIPDLDV